MNSPTQHRRILGIDGHAVAGALTLTVLLGLAIITASAPAQTFVPFLAPRGQAAFRDQRSARATIQLPAGSASYGVVFDGANIWVANLGSHKVTKLRVSDGEKLGAFAVAGDPWGMVYDGANIWVADLAFNRVAKLRASDGAALGTFPVGNGPFAVAFDGVNIWVTNSPEQQRDQASGERWVRTWNLCGGRFPMGHSI